MQTLLGMKNAVVTFSSYLMANGKLVYSRNCMGWSMIKWTRVKQDLDLSILIYFVPSILVLHNSTTETRKQTKSMDKIRREFLIRAINYQLNQL